MKAGDAAEGSSGSSGGGGGVGALADELAVAELEAVEFTADLIGKGVIEIFEEAETFARAH